jgi:putative membrane protein
LIKNSRKLLRELIYYQVTIVLIKNGIANDAVFFVPDRSHNVRILTCLIVIIVILLGITFASLNSGPVTIHYYIGQHTFSLPLLLVLVFAAGSLLGLIVGFWLVLKLKVKNYRLAQHLKIAEKEIQNLRVIPLQDRH